MKVCISVDLDNYQDYQSLVDTQLDAAAPTFYTDAVPRFLDVFDRCGIRATFFMIGRDAARAENRAGIREIVARGHEVGNHSYTHPYNFRQLTRQKKEREIDQGADAIADILGERPVGFRTPSCEIDEEILDILVERDYLYDSSVFPTPVMWAFMVYGRLFVRREQYQLGHPIVAFAPNLPYWPRMDALHRRRPVSDSRPPRILELPFSTLSGARIPFYSTLLRRLGPRFFSFMMRSYGQRRVVLHALFHLIELADFEGTALGDAFRRTPALAVSFEGRSRFVNHAMELLSASGESVTLREFAQWFITQQEMPDAA
ncbi:MAG: polysaccharide deacetylase family protein [Myxococcota bacterium]